MNQKQIIKANLPGWNGRLIGHHVCYLGNKHVHKALPYDPQNPKVVEKKIELLQADGYNGIAATWQGPWATENQQDAIMWAAECARVGMEFFLLLDPGGMRRNGQGNVTDNVTAALGDAVTQKLILGSPSYVKENLVLDFDTGANIDVLKQRFTRLNFKKKGVDFSWIGIPKDITESKARNLAAVADLKRQNSSLTMILPGGCYSFCDAGEPLPLGVQSQAIFDLAGGKRDFLSSTWSGPARRLESFSGQFFMQQLGVTPAKAPFFCITTVDDTDEETDVMKRLAEAAGVDWSKL